MNDAYTRETDMWNKVFSEYRPVDLRTLDLKVEPMFDEALLLFADNTTRVLDYGCGTGDISFQYLQYRPQHRITGIDLSETGIQFARKSALLSRYNTAEFRMGGDELLDEYQDNAFDGIILSNVLDVMPEDVSSHVMKKLVRILSPGGYWFVKMNPYYSKEELQYLGYTKTGKNIYEENHIMRLRQATTQYWKDRFSQLGSEIIYLEFEYPWQEGLNRLFVFRSEE